MTDIFEEIFLRVKEATGIKRQKELADFLGIREASISEAKKRGGFPPEWIVKLSTEHGLNPKWLLTGEGPMKITAESSDNGCKVSQFSVNKYVMGCEALVDEDRGRRLLEGIFYLKNKDPNAFDIMVGKVLEEVRRSREKEAAADEPTKKNGLPRGQGESSTG